MAIQLRTSGSNQALLGVDAGYDLTTGISLSCWIKLNSLPSVTGNSYALISKFGAAGNRSYLLTINNLAPINTAFITLSADGTTLVGAGSATVLTVGPWFHVVGTWSSADNTSRIYINGVVDGSVAFTGPLFNSSATFRIGVDGTNGQDTDGDIDDPRIYDVALSANMIQAIFARRGSDRNHENLVSRWTIADRSPGTVVVSAVPAIAGSVMTGLTPSTDPPSYSEGNLHFGRLASS